MVSKRYTNFLTEAARLTSTLDFSSKIVDLKRVHNIRDRIEKTYEHIWPTNLD